MLLWLQFDEGGSSCGEKGKNGSGSSKPGKQRNSKVDGEKLKGGTGGEKGKVGGECVDNASTCKPLRDNITTPKRPTDPLRMQSKRPLWLTFFGYVGTLWHAVKILDIEGLEQLLDRKTSDWRTLREFGRA